MRVTFKTFINGIAYTRIKGSVYIRLLVYCRNYGQPPPRAFCTSWSSVHELVQMAVRNTLLAEEYLYHLGSNVH
jgi:hypothetical protein